MSETESRERADAETWWDEHGQYIRAGGGEYERSFGIAGYEAAVQATRERIAKGIREKYPTSDTMAMVAYLIESRQV